MFIEENYRRLTRFLTPHGNFLSLTEVLNLYRNQLTEYERQEIDKFPEIWYLGLDSCKINAKPGAALNAGYDDDNGSYNKVSLRHYLYNSFI